jgi:hypothetical protein
MGGEGSEMKIVVVVEEEEDNCTIQSRKHEN